MAGKERRGRCHNEQSWPVEVRRTATEVYGGYDKEKPFEIQSTLVIFGNAANLAIIGILFNYAA